MGRRHTSSHLVLLSLLAATALAGCARQTEAPVDADPVRAGWTFFRLGEFDSAVRAFESAIASTPTGDPRHTLARYGLAATWHLRSPVGDQDPARARQAYETVIAAAPESDLAAWSLLALARMQHVVPVGQEPDFETVRGAYRALIRRFPEHLAGHEAFIHLQATYIQTLQPGPTRQAIAALEDFIARHPQSGFLSGANALIAAGYETLRDGERQLAAELRALETAEIDPTNPRFENSGNYWKIATIAEFEAGDFDTARRFYRRLMEEYPQDQRYFACEEALARMDAVVARLRAGGPPS